MNTTFRYNCHRMQPQTLVVSYILGFDVAGAILCPINLLPFHGGKEGLGHSIVMRADGCGKGLFNPKLLQQFRKCIRNVLSTSVTMKSQIFRISAFGISVPKSCCHKLCTGGAGYTIPNHSTRKQVNDCAKVHPRIFNSEISNIAYPDLIWMISIEFTV